MAFRSMTQSAVSKIYIEKLEFQFCTKVHDCFAKKEINQLSTACLFSFFSVWVTDGRLCTDSHFPYLCTMGSHLYHYLPWATRAHYRSHSVFLILSNWQEVVCVCVRRLCVLLQVAVVTFTNAMLFLLYSYICDNIEFTQCLTRCLIMFDCVFVMLVIHTLSHGILTTTLSAS